MSSFRLSARRGSEYEVQISVILKRFAQILHEEICRLAHCTKQYSCLAIIDQSDPFYFVSDSSLKNAQEKHREWES